MDPYRGFILQPTYRVRSGVPVVQLYGRLESGEAFLAEDDRFRPYFFIRCADVAARGQIERRDGVRVEETAQTFSHNSMVICYEDRDHPDRVPKKEALGTILCATWPNRCE